MPRMSSCKTTPKSRMGFSQIASCRAQGLIKRADGTKRKSPKYQRGSRSSRTPRRAVRRTSRRSRKSRRSPRKNR
jgi:hypothetical protein